MALLADESVNKVQLQRCTLVYSTVDSGLTITYNAAGRATDTQEPALFHADATLRYVSAKEETTCCPDPDVKIYSDGSCVWNREYQLSVTHCPLDITWFPFDKQDCNISYESLTQESQELSFTSEEDRPVRLDQYTPNGEWWLPGMTAQLRRTERNIRLIPNLCKNPRDQNLTLPDKHCALDTCNFVTRMLIVCQLLLTLCLLF